MAEVDNYTVDYNDQSGLYYIRGIKYGNVPANLEGSWTDKSLAETELVRWVEKQKYGKGKRQSASQSVRKGVNN